MAEPCFKLSSFPARYQQALREGTIAHLTGAQARFFPAAPSPIVDAVAVLLAGIPLMLPLPAVMIGMIQEGIGHGEYRGVAAALLVFTFLICAFFFKLGFATIRTLVMDLRERRAIAEGKNYQGLYIDQEFLVAHFAQPLEVVSIAVPRSNFISSTYEHRSSPRGPGHHVVCLRFNHNGKVHTVDISSASFETLGRRVADYLQAWIKGTEKEIWPGIDRAEAERKRKSQPVEWSAVVMCLTWIIGPLFGWGIGSDVCEDLGIDNWQMRSVIWIVLGAVLPVLTSGWYTVHSQAARTKRQWGWLATSMLLALTAWPAMARLERGVITTTNTIQLIGCKDDPAPQKPSSCLSYQITFGDGSSRVIDWHRVKGLNQGMKVTIKRVRGAVLSIEPQ